MQSIAEPDFQGSGQPWEHSASSGRILRAPHIAWEDSTP